MRFLETQTSQPYRLQPKVANEVTRVAGSEHAQNFAACWEDST